MALGSSPPARPPVISTPILKQQCLLGRWARGSSQLEQVHVKAGGEPRSVMALVIYTQARFHASS